MTAVKTGQLTIKTRLMAALLALLALSWPGLASAAVEIHFYSHEFGKEFPHAFVVLKGKLDATGETVDTNFGYSAIRISPAVLVKSVPGEVDVGIIPDEYIGRSQEHFSLVLSDEEYGAVIDVVDAWKARRQPSYNLNNANCVHFVSDVLLALHLKGEPRKGLMKSPHGFLTAVTADSAALIAAHVYKPPAAAPPMVTASAPSEGAAEAAEAATALAN
jgi:hypothetical protein